MIQIPAWLGWTMFVLEMLAVINKAFVLTFKVYAVKESRGWDVFALTLDSVFAFIWFYFIVLR